MKAELLLVILVLTAVGFAEDKGSCPSEPMPASRLDAKPAAPPGKPPAPDLKYAGTVSIKAVVSNTGYICSAKVVRGINKDVDKKTLATVKTWHLKPATKDGVAVPVVVRIDIAYWRNKKGELVQAPEPQQK